jgi:hypothetical protein
MPEILTKHPEIVKAVLTRQGAQCGTQQQPKILKDCPADQFCSLAGGELCVFGPNDLGKMKQLEAAEVCRSATTTGSLGHSGGASPIDLVLSIPIALAGILTVGLWPRTAKPRSRG